MMQRASRFGSLFAAVLVIVAGAGAAEARNESGLSIEARPVPGQLDVLQGTALQLGGKQQKDGPPPTSYEWRIVRGEGAELLHADRAEAIFQAPTIDTEFELFIVELTVRYGGGEPATARLHVRVHRDKPEESPTAWLEEHYRREAAEKARRKNARRARNRAVASVRHSYYPSWYGGYTWGWGRFVHYPVYVPIVIPPPGIDWGPGDGSWVEPLPIPYDEMVTTFPERIAGDYLPQDFPIETAPFEPYAGSFASPDPIDLPMAGGFDEPMMGGFDEPLMGGFDEPMIDVGFDADPFGW
jgi:hypothetical protein